MCEGPGYLGNVATVSVAFNSKPGKTIMHSLRGWSCKSTRGHLQMPSERLAHCNALETGAIFAIVGPAQ